MRVYLPKIPIPPDSCIEAKCWKFRMGNFCFSLWNILFPTERCGFFSKCHVKCGIFSFRNLIRNSIACFFAWLREFRNLIACFCIFSSKFTLGIFGGLLNQNSTSSSDSVFNLYWMIFSTNSMLNNSTKY
jgi:hypothetical protein